MSELVQITRRRFGKWSSQILMLFGLAASYGTFGLLAGRYLYPKKRNLKWVFLFPEKQLRKGEAFPFELPSGVSLTIARKKDAGDVSDYVALSTTCPHLGCRAHWESQNNRFFCPCHNGVFDPTGKAISGPPAAAKQDLEEYPLRLEKGLLYVGMIDESLGKKIV